MVLVFDLGGTKLRLALAQNGEIGDIIRLPTDTSAAGFAKFLGVLQEMAGSYNIKAIGGGVPGQLSGEDGELVVATNLPEWRGLPLLARMNEMFSCPVHIANDVELCGMGEARFGAGITGGVMAYYTVSTGVNGVRLVDGDVDGTVGRYELGKQVLAVGGKAGPQELESLIGGAAMQHRLSKAPAEVKDPKVWHEAERHLAVALHNTQLYWDPELIVLGGSMMRDIKIGRVAAELEKLPAVYDQRPRLALAKLGDEAGLQGAVAWLEELGYR